MTDADRYALLERGWTPVLAWYDTADVRCPCKSLVAPLVAEWRAFAAAPDMTDGARQTSNLAAAVGTIQKYAASRPDDDPAWAPLLDGIARMRIGADSEACAVGDPRCQPLAPLAPLTVDPPLGAAEEATAPLDLGGLFGDLLKPAATAGKATGQAAGQAAAGEVAEAIPSIAEAIRREIPATVAAVTQAAGPAVVPLATQAGGAAGQAAGQAAAKAAKDEGVGDGAKVAGVVVVLVALAGGGLYLAKRRMKK